MGGGAGLDERLARRYAGSQSLKFYLDPGEGLSAYFGSDGGSNFLQEISFSGYLVKQ